MKHPYRTYIAPPKNILVIPIFTVNSGFAGFSYVSELTREDIDSGLFVCVSDFWKLTDIDPNSAPDTNLYIRRQAIEIPKEPQ